MEQRVLRRIQSLRLPCGGRIIVGFSGGQDSLALLGVLSQVSSLAGFEPVAVHVDHGLRPDSAAEQAIVARLAADIGVRFRGVRIDAAGLACHHGVGIEEAARRERYRWLANVAREEETRLVALAHHQMDQAETVLLHLLRGAGLAGAAAMADVCQRQIPWWNDAAQEQSTVDLVIWRPFLSEPKSVIAAYGERLGLTPVEDPSNRDCRYRRNAIRHQVLPLLEEIQTGATAALARHAALIAGDDDVLAGLAASFLASETSRRGHLTRAEIMEQPPAMQRRIVRAWLADAIAGVEISAERIEAVRTLLESGEGGKVIEIGAGHNVTLRGGVLRAVPHANRVAQGELKEDR